MRVFSLRVRIIKRTNNIKGTDFCPSLIYCLSLLKKAADTIITHEESFFFMGYFAIIQINYKNRSAIASSPYSESKCVKPFFILS